MRIAIALLFILVLSLQASAATIRVPQDQATIQAGINAAVDGDTVLVGPGVHSGMFSVLNKVVFIKSAEGAEATFLDWTSIGSPKISFVGVSDGLLEGFTVQDQSFAPIGHAIEILNSNMDVLNNRFINIGDFSTLLWADTDSTCLITVKGNLFARVNATSYMIGVMPGASSHIVNNTIYGTRIGIIAYSDGSVVKNNIISYCSVYGYYNAEFLVEENFNCFWGNLENRYDLLPVDGTDLLVDPHFVDSVANDFSLSADSPCINAGDPNPLYNDPDGSRNDMGAFSFVLPIEFNLIAPAADQHLTDTMPLFLWEEPVDTTGSEIFSYVLYWSQDALLASPDSSPVLVDTFWNSTTVFAPLTRWYWRVAARSNTGYNYWSGTTGSFYIDYIPSSPTVFAPSDSSEILAGDWLLWTESLDLDANDSLWYNVQIASNNLFDVLLCNVTIREDSLGPNPQMAKDAITGLQIGSIAGYANLSDDSYYHWRVRGIDKYGGTSAFSPGSHVFFLNKANTPPHAISATIYPKAGEPVNDLTPALSWYSAYDPDPSDDAAHLRYFVQVDDNPDFAGPYVKSYWTAFGQPSVEIDSLPDETHYYYRIQTVDDEGAVSLWSATYDFWTNWRNDFPTNFNLVLPANNKLSVGITPQFSWRRAIDTDPLDAVSYTLVLALDPGFLFKVEFPGIADTIFSLASPLSYSEDYWWKVKAVDHYEGTTWSSQTFRFKTRVPGDADGNGVVTISDVVFLINYIFSGGPAPNPLASGDADCSGAISISDAVYLIQYIFSGGPMPCEG